MLTTIIAITLIILALTFVLALTIYPAIIIPWIPAAIIAYIIISTCLVIIPGPQSPEPGHYCCHKAGSYGYTDEAIYPPNYEGLKWPWTQLDIISYDYSSMVIAEIPCQTNDGMRMMYRITAPVDTVRFNPLQFQQLYAHNVSNYNLYAVQTLKPHLDAIMSTISEADFELGHPDFDAIQSTITTHIPQAGLDWKNNKPTCVAYFNHIDNPQYNYACTEFPGLCAQGDALGLPKSDNRYNGQRRTITLSPTIIEVTPEPTPIYIDDSSAISTQAEMNAIIDDVIAHPEKYQN